MDKKIYLKSIFVTFLSLVYIVSFVFVFYKNPDLGNLKYFKLTGIILFFLSGWVYQSIKEKAREKGTVVEKLEETSILSLYLPALLVPFFIFMINSELWRISINPLPLKINYIYIGMLICFVFPSIREITIIFKPIYNLLNFYQIKYEKEKTWTDSNNSKKTSERNKKKIEEGFSPKNYTPNFIDILSSNDKVEIDKHSENSILKTSKANFNKIRTNVDKPAEDKPIKNNSSIQEKSSFEKEEILNSEDRNFQKEIKKFTNIRRRR